MKFFKNSSLGGDALILTASKIAVSILGLVSSMLLARFRTLTEYGTYSQIIMITDLISTFLLLGLPGCVNYFVAKAKTQQEKQQFVTIYVILSTFLTTIIAICLFFATPLIVEYFNNPYITTFTYIFAIYPWASIMLNSLSNVCVVYGKARKLIVFNFIHTMSTLILLLFAKFLNISFYNYTLLYIGSMLLFAVFALFWIRSMVGGFRFTFSLPLVKSIFAFSVPLGLASVVGTLNIELDKLVIANFFTTEQYALFANAAKEMPVTMVAASLTTVLIPAFVRLLNNNKAQEAVRIWGNAANISFCIMFLFAGGFFVFAPDIMSLFYSEKYVTSDSITVFRIYSTVLLFRAVYWGIFLNALGKTKLILYSSILTLALNFVFNILFCNIFGFVGPAIATLMVTEVMAWAQMFYTSKIIKISVFKMLPYGNIGKLSLQTICIGVAMWLVKNTFFKNFTGAISILIAIGLGILWCLLYGALNYKFIIDNWRELNKAK